MQKIIYLDNAATTFQKPEKVYEVMDFVNRNLAVNSGRGSYKLSREASNIIKSSRQNIAKVLDIENYNKIIFTASATIAINQILLGLDWSNIKNILVSPFEHNAIMRTINSMRDQYSFNIEYIPFNKNTLNINEQELKILASEKKIDLILVSHVSNVTGLILPIENIFEIFKQSKPIKLIDASQSAGLVKLNFSDYDFLVFAGHKTLYGPFGIAGFVKNSDIKLKTIITGGTGSNSTNLQMPNEIPYKYESGSYNIQAIAGINESVKWINEMGIDSIFEKEKVLTKYLVEELSDIKELQLYIPSDENMHIGIVSFTVCGFDSSEFADILDDEFNIAVRAGHHCAPNVGEFLGGQAEDGIIRVSISFFNSKEEINKLKKAIVNILGGE